MMYNEETHFLESYRPSFHFSPNKGWMNDPNGLCFYEGEYHLFFQHYPDDIKWGPMHWGHAVGTDLVHWEELPIALYPDKLGMVFSGSMVVDAKDSSSFFDGGSGLVAIFTHSEVAPQAQSLAYSSDKGRTWTKYADNPVIANPGMADFRDPKVIFHEASKKWVMVLACHDHIRFYSSDNLIQWQLESEFGHTYGAHGGVWECPDLFCLPVENTAEEKWVLSVNINPGGFAGGSANQWFLGNFNGHVFTCDDSPETVRWVDYGKDFYASQSFFGLPDKQNRHVLLAWMNNWLYADKVPTKAFCSGMTFAREIKLRKQENTYVLVQHPVPELETVFNKDKRDTLCLYDLEPNGPIHKTFSKRSFHMNLLASCSQPACFDLSLQDGEAEILKISVCFLNRTIQVQRFMTEAARSCNDYEMDVTVPVLMHDDMFQLQMLVDNASVELFAENGEVCFTQQIYPDADSLSLHFSTKKEPVLIELLELIEM